MENLKLKNKNKGFSTIEIIIAIFLFTFIFTILLSFIYNTGFINKTNINLFEKKIYNKTDYCNINDLKSLTKNILETNISTTSKITDIIINNNYVIISTDNNVLNENDIYIFNIIESKLKFIYAFDTGPGINDIEFFNNKIYIANTSLNSQLQIVSINIDKKTYIIDNVIVPSLKSSYSNAKKIKYDFEQNKILIGSEKNSNGGELFIFSNDYKLEKEIEINGQVNDIYINDNYYIANASDPELIIIDKNNANIIDAFDADKTLGNGKSLELYEDKLIFGRTLAGIELYILNYINKINIKNILNLNGSIDMIKILKNNSIILLTSDIKNNPILMKYDEKNNIFNKSHSLNEYRYTAFACNNNFIIAAQFIDNNHKVIWYQ